MPFSIEDERKKRSINEMFGDEDSDDSGDEQISRSACHGLLHDKALNSLSLPTEC